MKRSGYGDTFWFKVAKDSYNNYISVLLKLLIKKKYIYVKIKNCQIAVKWKRENVLNHIVANSFNYSNPNTVKINAKENIVTFNYKNKILTFNGYLENGWVYKEITEFEYNNLHFKGKVVIDIGANTGGTSIYFALNGALHVYSIEASPLAFQYLKNNIINNFLSEVITPIRAAINSKNSKLILSKNKSFLGANIKDIATSSDNVNASEVQAIRFIDLIKSLNLNKCVVKMDCEGCEYVALNDDNSDAFNVIEEIIMEYHNYSEIPINYLNGHGFEVVYPHISKHEKVGILYAKKRI